jgi:phosphate:Na+ symporter
VLRHLSREIEDYLTAVDPETLDEPDNDRLSEILAFVTNIEHAGRLVDKGLIGSVSKGLRRGLSFSVEGQTDIHEMLGRLITNVHSSAAVFMTDDARAARALLGEKEVFRNFEAKSTETHFERMRAGRAESRETSSLHLDALRDMKRINSHIAAAAYPVLERQGELLPSRLRQDADTGDLADQHLD